MVELEFKPRAPDSAQQWKDEWMMDTDGWIHIEWVMDMGPLD